MRESQDKVWYYTKIANEHSLWSYFIPFYHKNERIQKKKKN